MLFVFNTRGKMGGQNEISFRSRTASGCPRVQSSKLPEGSISVMEVQENGDLEGCEAIIAISDLGNNYLTISMKFNYVMLQYNANKDP